MYGVDLDRRVRLACHHEGLSRREAARRFGIDRKTVAKMLMFSVPPGYQRSDPPSRPKLDGFTGIIDRILEERRPPRLNLDVYPYLPKAMVATTSARSHMSLLSGAGT